jgi:hypothetical protein
MVQTVDSHEKKKSKSDQRERSVGESQEKIKK